MQIVPLHANITPKISFKLKRLTMKMDELELSHWQVSPRYSLGGGIMDAYDAKKHTNISIQFAIDCLKEVGQKMEINDQDPKYITVLIRNKQFMYEKIKELHKYLHT